MRAMRNYRHIYIELYRVNVYFILCSSEHYERKIRHEFEAKSPSDTKNSAGKFEVYEKDGQEICVIWITDWEFLAHEIFHCVHWIMHSKGLWLTNSSEEAYAYLTEFLDRKLRKESK